MTTKKKNDGGPITGHFLMLPRGHELTFSKEDQDLILNSSWCVGANGYVYKRGARIKGMQCLLHRIILSVSHGQEVHHKNRDKLDNRRENLEITTPSEHQKHHRDSLIARNIASIKYSKIGNCIWCNKVYLKDPNHRGRSVCCSKLCGVLRAAKISKEKRNAKKTKTI